MRHPSNTTIAAMILAAQTAAYGAPAAPGEKPEFQLQDTHTAKGAHGATASKITPTKTEAAMKMFEDVPPLPSAHTAHSTVKTAAR